MIYLCTQGGIGNQLFQIAYAIKLSKLYKKKIYLLKKHLNPRGGDKRARSIENLGFDFPYSYKFLPNSKLIRSFYVKYLSLGTTYIDDKTKGFQFNSNNDFIIDGFFQNPIELEEVKDDIRNVIKAKLSELKIDKMPSNRVAIHIRRGDYISNLAAAKSHGFVGLQYYLNAIEITASNIKEPIYDIYTDDIKWVNDNIVPIIPANIKSKEGFDSNLEFLNLMGYQNFIIANSSFSWWAPWLNCYKDNCIVICPKNWYANKKECNLNKIAEWHVL